MQQFVFKDKIYIMGRIDQVVAQLHELAEQFITVKEYLEYRTRDL